MAKHDLGLKHRLRSASKEERAAIIDGLPYDSGYAKPPRHGQYSSDNQPARRGRTKGSENLATVLADESAVKIEVSEGGKLRKLSKLRVGMRQLVNKFASGDPRATETFADLMRKTGQLDSAPAVEQPVFAPIGLMASTPVVIMSHPSVPAKSISELIALAKKEAGKLTAGVPVIGSGSHLASEMFKSAANVDLNIISYKGTGPLTNDLLGGHVSIGFNTIAPALGNIQAGKLRALGVASLTRSKLLPDVPTVSEAGLPGFQAVLRYGLVAPAGTPRDIELRLNKELNTILTLPDVIKRISLDGSEPLRSTPEEYAADIDREEKRWGAIVRRLKLKGG